MPNKFSFVDEVGTIIFLFPVLRRVKFEKKIKKTLSALGILTLLGGIFTIFGSVQPPLLAWSLEIIGLYKLPIAFLFFAYCLSEETIKKVASIMKPVAKLLIILVGILAIINLFKDIGMSFDTRYGFRSFEFIYNNPAKLLTFVVICLFFIIDKNINRKNIVYVISGFLILFIGSRGGAYATMALFCALKFLLGKKRNIKIRSFIVPGILAAYFARIQIIKYFFTSTEVPRTRLWHDGINLFVQHFPFGMGYGSFGSEAAERYYSPVYYSLGYNYIWGFAPGANLFLNDNFWPMVLVEFGICGVFIFVYVLYQLFTIIRDNFINWDKYLLGVSLFGYVVFVTFASASITGTNGFFEGVILGMVVNVVKGMKDEK
jgi:hypothetical protein